MGRSIGPHKDVDLTTGDDGSGGSIQCATCKFEVKVSGAVKNWKELKHSTATSAFEATSCPPTADELDSLGVWGI